MPMLDEIYDAVIIGGGPAGASCAIWLKLLGYNPCIVEQQNKLGGLQNINPYPNPWVAILPTLTGHEVATNTTTHVKDLNITCYLDSVVQQVLRDDKANHFSIDFSSQSSTTRRILAKFVVIATGVRPASGGFLPHTNFLIGPGLTIENYNFMDKHVAILGGGDNAFENFSIIQRKKSASIQIFARSIVARKEFLSLTPTTQVYYGDYSVNPVTNEVNNKKFDCIVVMYGWETAIDFSTNFALHFQDGFITTDSKTAETSEQGVYAIGEVANRAHPCCVTAMADGVAAAKAIQRKLEGDFVKTYLEKINPRNTSF